MNQEKAKELHSLLFTFMGTFHEKFVVHFRKNVHCEPRIKKNHAKIIHILYQNDSLTPTEIGKMLDIEKGGLTTIIDQLAEMGLILRSADPGDRRKILLSLSPEGKAHMEEVIQKFTQTLMDLFEDVDAKELEKYLVSLRHVVEFMQKL
ncbi:MarR family winged helix-turn-helix transcriptional regulator [Desulforamulus ruminis]|uniref:Regulatory protein MarR n=1 Tax=Desulforamulus ruminis (strain ATCC 23193 / DSM 2154 / NCIMB 8452 / DL) TaxID=696281 RepID=F6DK53_DESRL|nr:MarR family transcriptional regulator [Desulforamulus ruminis]AEG60367.1 regulatory protein MarR [Desulforamulus ruminis DSM 2154]